MLQQQQQPSHFFPILQSARIYSGSEAKCKVNLWLIAHSNREAQHEQTTSSWPFLTLPDHCHCWRCAASSSRGTTLATTTRPTGKNPECPGACYSAESQGDRIDTSEHTASRQRWHLRGRGQPAAGEPKCYSI